jgi:quinoprotein glucose dehydrogenase
LKDPKVADFLNDSSELVVLEAARAIHDDFSIPEALPALAKQLVFTESNNEALLRRMINANFRLGGVNEAYLVAEYAADNSKDPAMRLEALDALATWKEPAPLDRVDGRRRYFKPRPIAEVAKTVRGFLEGLLASKDSDILEKTVTAANSLSVPLSPTAMEKLLQNNQAASSLRVQALKSIKDPKTITYALNSNDEGLRMTAAEFLTATNKASATDYLIKRLDMSRSITETQRVLAMLGGLGTPEADEALRAEAQALSEGQINAALQLDVIEAVTKRNLTNELAGFENSRPANSKINGYIESLEGGDPAAGKKIANNHLAAQCVRCHKFGKGSGSDIGPNLSKIASKRDREYLLRSLVDPGADIAEGYGMTTVALKSGETVSAQLGKKSKKGIELTLADGSSRTIPAAEIIDQTEPISSMPPMGYILSKRELRDVVAYLSSLTE